MKSKLLSGIEGFAGGILPLYLRLPRNGEKCSVSGLCRSTIYELVSGPTPAVKSKLLKQPGSKRGIRLIETASLVAYLQGLPDFGAELELEGSDHE